MYNYTGFIYLWHNTKNNKMYIGSHYGTVNDNYIGSGVYFIRAYNKNPEVFQRYIIEYVNGSYTELITKEEYYLQKYDAANSPKFYNLTNACNGGKMHEHLTEERRNEIYEKCGAASRARLQNMTPIEKIELKNKKVNSWKTSPKLEAHKTRTRERRILEELNMSEEEKKERANQCKKRYYTRPLEERQAIYKKRAKTVTEWHANMSEADKIARIEKMKETKKQKQEKYIHKDGVCKKVSKQELQTYIDDGWNIGRGMKRQRGKCRWMNNGEKQIHLEEYKIKEYLDNGYSFGMLPRKLKI